MSWPAGLLDFQHFDLKGKTAALDGPDSAVQATDNGELKKPETPWMLMQDGEKMSRTYGQIATVPLAAALHLTSLCG